jgi:hypothetical protein
MGRTHRRAPVGQKAGRLTLLGLTILFLSSCGEPSNLNCLSDQPLPGSGGATQAELCGAEFRAWIDATPWAIPVFVAGAIVLLIVFVTALVLLWQKAGRPRRKAQS